MKKYWRIWCKAIGSKEGRSDEEADSVALVRTLFLIVPVMITNMFIIAGVIRHWG